MLIFPFRTANYLGRKEAEIRMSVARVTELSATSETSFEDAINVAVARATKTLRGVEGAWVKDQNVLIEDGNIVGYKVMWRLLSC